MEQMFLRKLLLGVLGGIFCSLLFVSCIFKSSTRISAISAVPSSSPIILKFNNISELSEELNGSCDWWNSMSGIDGLKLIRSYVDQIDSLNRTNPEFSKIANDRELWVAVNLDAKNKLDLLCVTSLDGSKDRGYAEDYIKKIVAKNSFTVKKRKYNNVSLYELFSPTSADMPAGYSFVHNLLIFSNNSMLVEEAIRQTEVDFEKENTELAQLMKTIDSKADANVFVNHELAVDLISLPLSAFMQHKAKLSRSYSAWTELDVNLKQDKVLLSGFSNGDPEKGYFSTVFQNQNPGVSKIETIIPYNAPYFGGFYLSDIDKYFEDYRSYLQKKNALLKREEQIDKLEKITGTNLEKLIAEVFDNEAAIFGVSIDQSVSPDRKAWAMKTKSGSFALTKMLDFQRSYLNAKNMSADGWKKEFKIDNQTSFQLYKFPIENFPSLLFGQIFKGAKTGYVTLYANYLIFADSYETLSKVLLSNVLGETLMSDEAYVKFQQGMTSKNNFNFYCNTSLSLPLSSMFFNNEIASDLSSNNELRKFKIFAWQVSSSGNMIYNNACLYYNPTIESKPKTVWQSRLLAPSTYRPQFVHNFNDPENKEIVIQDNADNFYLINNVGRILWQIKLESPIIGEVHQIDFYKNGKLQYLFNTKERLYLVDRNGNDVENFPINFRTNATNGVAVFDYEKNRNYRFFVACDDHEIYAYDQEGGLLEGWKSIITDHVVNQPIQHIAIEGKDYIVASDQMKDYILDRKGNIRVETQEVYPHSSNNKVYLEKRSSSHEPRLVATDKEGNIHRTYFDGRHEVISPANKLSENHFFVVSNVDGDDEMEYVFADGTQLFIQGNTGKNLFSYSLDSEITYHPAVYQFSNMEKKIGVTCKSTNKVYLFSLNGSISQGFPLDGCSEFSIGLISEGSSNFNLLVASPDGHLYNYYVK